MSKQREYVPDKFKEAGIEVQPVKNIYTRPWGPQDSIACVYGGRHRMVNANACQWHGEHRDLLCAGCPRASWIVKPKSTAGNKQGKLFGGASWK
jgi:hypothetical protein